jgi:hypothetical protein
MSEILAPFPYPRPTSLLLAVLGPTLLGAALGMKTGLGSMALCASVLPAIVLGVALLMAPAFYIGASLLGRSPSSTELARATGLGLRACGTTLLGLLPPTLFLLSTASKGAGAAWLCALALACASLVGTRRLYAEIYPQHQAGFLGWVFFAGWSLLSLGIGLDFYSTLARTL